MKENRQNLMDDTLLQLIPRRQMVRAQDFISAANTKDAVFPKSADYLDLVDTALEEQKYFENNANENSRFCYISHQKKDGILSAKVLAGKLRSKDSKKPAPVCNPSVDEKNLSDYIRWPRLRDKALAENLVAKEKLPLSSIMLSVISGIVLILDLLGKSFELTDYTGDNAFLNILKSFNAGIVLTCILIALIVTSAALIIVHTRKSRKTLIAKVNQALREMDTKDFVEFLSDFGSDDFRIPDCDTEATVFLCVLQNYSIKERHILSAYWRHASHRQIWWIFAEATRENEAFVLPEARKYSRRFFFQKPLNKADKHKIAEKTYSGKTRISPAEDSGISIFGVDWLYRFHLKEREPLGDTEQLKDKLDAFCRTYAASYQTDIKLVIRLVADLACTYHFDFFVRKNWEYLFSDKQGDPLLNTLDKQITDALNLNNKAFRNLIPEIMDVFSKDLEEIVADHPNNEQTSEYEQWCIIKALKTRTADPEECYLSICDTLMVEFANCAQNPEDIGTSDLWRDILLKTAEIFYKKQFFWFLPTLLHNLLFFFGGRSDQRLFSQNIVLEIARTNLLLGIQTGAGNYLSALIDPVRDHYEIVCAAVTERREAERLSDNTSVPLSFELLHFTNLERRRYCNALHILREQTVMDFLDCLFDMFCAVVSTNEINTQFCYSALYGKSLFADYLEKTGLTATKKNYIAVISCRLLALLDSNLGGISTVKRSIGYLQAALAEGRPVEDLLLLIAELDVLGFNTLNFIACMLGLVDESEGLSRDIYLNLGNYLLGVVFLAYYELLQRTFYNEDFKYLIAICTNHVEPGNTTLGFLYTLDTRPTPANSGARIRAYIQRHKDIYLESLHNLAARIKCKDLENFFVFLSCIGSITAAEKTPIFEMLQQNIEANYAAEPSSKFYLELISLILSRCSTAEFADSAPDAIMDEILNLSPNMLYLLFSQYYELWPTAYAGFCHAASQKVMKSNFVGTVNLLISCLTRIQNLTDPEDFAQTSKLVFSAMDNHLPDQRISDILTFQYFLKLLIDRRKTSPELYTWASEGEIVRKFARIDAHRQQLAKLQTEAFCAERKWTNYGIAIYLHELMLTDNRGFHSPESYKTDGSAADQNAYFINHFRKMHPLIMADDQLLFNVAYLHMLVAFIRNSGDIQHALDEKDCMHKLAKDLKMVVTNHENLTDDQKSRVHRLISEYHHLSA